MKLVTLEGVTTNKEKYHKLVVDGYYSRSGWFPIADGTPTNEEGMPADDQFKVIKTKEKGTIMFVPQNTKNDRRVVVAGQVWGGFRGGADISKEDTTATVLWETTSSKHCKGCVAFIAIIGLDEELVVHGSGRRHNQYYIFTNENGELQRESYQGDEYEASKGLLSSYEDAEDL
jgi:hypothetical protein